MHQKRLPTIATIIIILMVASAAVCSSVTKKDSSIPLSAQYTKPANTQIDYAVLANECKNKKSEGCCLSSVEAMRKGSYTLVPQKGCPVGYQPSGLRCIDSYGWCQPISTSSTQRPVTEVSVPMDGIEDGGYGGTAFCSVISQTNFELKGSWLTILGKGPYPIRINKMRIVFSPYEYPNVKLISHVRLEDKNNSYADTLYIGDDRNLYDCHGGK